MLIPILVILFFLFVIYAANQADTGAWSDGTLQAFFYSLSAVTFLIAPFGMQAVMMSMQPGNEDLREILDVGQVAFVSSLALIAAVFGYNLVRTPELREWVALRLPAYNPVSFVHQAAVLLIMLVLLLNLFNFVLSGGISGVADSFEDSTGVLYSSIFEATLFVTVGFLGAGYAIRRTLLEVLARLGLRMPTQQDVMWGVGMGLILCSFSFAFSIIWSELSDPETFAEQTEAANQISRQIDSLQMAVLISTSSAVGEEIFMRGALQPVFGIWLTSGFFALLHSQYLLTPTVVFIFLLGAAFGYMRLHISTTAAIIAHFVYNLTPFLLLVLVGGAV